MRLTIAPAKKYVRAVGRIKMDESERLWIVEAR